MQTCFFFFFGNIFQISKTFVQHVRGLLDVQYSKRMVFSGLFTISFLPNEITFLQKKSHFHKKEVRFLSVFCICYINWQRGACASKLGLFGNVFGTGNLPTAKHTKIRKNRHKYRQRV